jgi:hypothetical protein
MKLSKEQKAELEQRLSTTWGQVALMCDGYRVDLQVQRWKGGIQYRVMVYVNGHFKGLWTSGKTEYPEQKFLRKSVRPLYTPAQKAKLEKALGKRWVAKDPAMKATVTIYLPDFASGKAAIGHLHRVCESIEILEMQ